jgi:peroxiredoxin
MALMHTPDKQEDFSAPDFSLKGVDGLTYTLSQCCGENGTLIMFICNHCPYVIGVIDRLVKTCSRLKEEGIECVAIMANDTEKYPADSYENMQKFAQEHNFSFPYLIDESQDIAKAYDAVCTPDFFGFDKNGILQYRGRLDSAANKPAGENTVPELFNAMMEVKENGSVTAAQTPSMGCSIKWK